MATGIELYDGTVTDCVFDGDATAIESFGDNAVISNNRFMDDLQVKLNYSSYTQVTGNIFNASTLNQPYLNIIGGANIVVSDNFFDGNNDESQEVISIGGGYAGLSITGNIISSGVLLDRGDSNEDVLSIVGNTWTAGGGILMDVGVTNWRYSDFLIAGNNMDAWHHGGSAFIHILGTAYIHGLSIIDNVLSSTGVNAGAGPLIDVSFPDTTASNGRAIRIVGNKVVDRRGAAYADLAIRVTGPTTKTDGSVEVSGNHVEASDGIQVTYVRDLVFRGNTIAVDEVSGQQGFYSGQVNIENCGTAVVEDNAVVGGEDGDKASTTAVFNVEAVNGGSFRDNDVWGIVSGAMDTAMIVDGPFYITGNAYHGAHSLNAGTPLSPELEVLGTGATIGENEATVDDSGATTPTRLTTEIVTFAKSGVLTTTTGQHRFYLPYGAVITEVEASVGTAPTGASLVTIFTTQSNRPQIAISSFVNSSTTIEDATHTDGQYLTVDIDQIGSTVAGSDLTVVISYERS